MLKKFVQLGADASPSQNPYEVRTYMGDSQQPEWKVEGCPPFDRKCDKPANSTISQVITIEDEIRRIHQKAKESRFLRPFKKRCELYDEFTMCVVPQRTPRDLKTHAVMREHLLKAKGDIDKLEIDARTGVQGRKKTAAGLVILNSPMNLQDGEEEETTLRTQEEEEEEEGEEEEKKVKPQLASPDCSKEIIMVPPKKLLELRRPKSGLYLNESEIPDDDQLPYQSYNPRDLQMNLESQGMQAYDIIEGCKSNDLWTWNVGLQKRESELDRAFIDASLPKYDCQNIELTVYKIPKDLDKTFTAEIVFGGLSIIPEPPGPKNRIRYYFRPREIACIIVAYVESFRMNPDFWTAETMDSILVRGGKLLKKSISLNYKSPDTDFDIIPIVKERQASVGLKIHFTGPLKNEPNIYKALSLYFSKYNAAILCSKRMYLLIWKRCATSYYVFDPNGRNEQCERDFDQGKCSLMATRFVEHLVHLIMTFSDADMEEEFNLYEIYLTSYGKLADPFPSKMKSGAPHKLWAVVNESFAIKPGNNSGLQQPISGNEKNASLIVSLIALLYSEFERASLWRSITVDDLLKYGQAYYKTLRKKFKLDSKRHKKKPHLNIVDLPEMFLMGAFKATVRKHPFLLTGHVADCRNYLDSQLTLALQHLFGLREWEAALIQIDNSVLGVWRDTEFFYVFDPFRRNQVGQVVDPDDYRTKGVACLQLHSTFESLCRNLYNKALKMRRGGKFFIHGIRIGCIRPLQIVAQRKNKFPALEMSLPTYTDEPEVPELKAKKSIATIPDEERIPEISDDEVVETMLDEILCEIFKKLPDVTPERPHLYKQAEKLLLRSDKAHLQKMRLQLKRGEDIEAELDFVQPPQVPSLEEELLIPSNFEMLPDGTWVIFGTTKLPVLDAEMSKLSGLLSGLITATLASKYKISTWNSDLIEFALESANGFGDNYQSYEYTLSAVLAKNLPDITIGQTNFTVLVPKIIKSTMTLPLRQVLIESLIHHSRLLVICTHFSCIIIKRYNFLYMFIGFPCNPVGYRKYGAGPACMLRFVELDSLIRRIEFGCNPEGCEITNYVVAALKVIDNTNIERFRHWPKSEEEAMFSKEYKRREDIRKQRMEKMHYIDQELKKEDQRIQEFLLAKERIEQQRKKKSDRRIDVEIKRPPKRKRKKRQRFADEVDENEEEFGFEEEGEAEGEGEEETTIKHKPGKYLAREVVGRYKPRPILYGYRMREKDCLYKIQGSKAMEGREESNFSNLKSCFFASTLAIIYAILRNLHQWSSYRIDRVIDNANAIVSKVCDFQIAFERVIKHVTVDDYEFDVWVKSFEPAGVQGLPLNRKIMRATHSRRYLLLYTANATYAIYRDEFYHLFDPYASMDLGAGGEGDAEEEEKKKCPKVKSKKFRERNTASWVLFADIDMLLDYIDDRNPNSGWKDACEYKFFVVDVLSYKKAAPNARILRLLTDLSVPMTCTTDRFGHPEYEICTSNESLGWLELENCLPVWSRLNRRNTAGRYRNLPISRFKKYDVEIEGRLWSLWGNLHPQAPVFEAMSRGRQYLACYVMACCAASIYRLMDWSPQMLDTIVISGDKYHRESIETIHDVDYAFSVEDLNLDCMLENIKFVVHIEHVAFGKLYCTPSHNRMNLAESLIYFFSHFQFGIVQCRSRAIAIGFTPGHDGGYFMYDCQDKDHPLFPKGQGASYLLRTKHLQVLLYCIVVTLNVPFYNVHFSIHKVEMLREGASMPDEEDEEGEDEEER